MTIRIVVDRIIEHIILFFFKRLVDISSVNRHEAFTALNRQYALEQSTCVAFQELVSCLMPVKNRYSNKLTVIAIDLPDMEIYRNILISAIGNDLITNPIRNDHFF